MKKTIFGHLRTIIVMAGIISAILCLCACDKAPDIDLPEDFPKLETKGKSKVEGEFMTALNGSFGYYLVKLDEKGRICWYRKMWEPNPIGGGRIYDFSPVDVDPADTAGKGRTDGSDEVSYWFFQHWGEKTSEVGFSELVMLNSDYEEIDRLRYELGDRSLGLDNHDALVFGKDDYIISTSLEETADNIPEAYRLKGGNSIQSVYIKEVEDGKIKWEFRSKDHPEFYGYKMEDVGFGDDYNDSYDDYMHFNSLLVDPQDGNLLVSFRNQCSIVKLSRETGEVIWIMGGKGNGFDLDEDARFACQHSISFTKAGNLLMYDNGMPQSGSRILELKVDERAMKVRMVREIPLDVDTRSWGLVEEVDDDVFLVNEGQTTDPDHDNTFYEIDAKTGKKSILVTAPEAQMSYWIHKEKGR